MKLEIPDDCAAEFMILIVDLADELDGYDMDEATEAERKAHEFISHTASTYRAAIAAETPAPEPAGPYTSVADGIELAASWL